MKIEILQGLPASGKSTYAKQKCESDTNWVRVNRDDLRSMRGQYWLPQDEDMITEWEIACIISAMNHNKNVIIDATNFNKRFTHKLQTKIVDAFSRMKAREIWKCIISFRFLDIYVVLFKHLEFQWKYFDTPLEVCIERDKNRAKPVGENVIRGFYKKYFNEKGYVKAIA